MSDIIKKPYSISIWEDKVYYLITEGDEAERYEVDQLPVGRDYKILNQYTKEINLATIGSHNSDSPIKAFDPKLVRNINGSNTLTFQLYYRYYDDEVEDFKFNPLIDLLVNERKVKLFYDDRWFDFVVKSIKENSENNTFIYTCKDLHINELSKNGYDITLDIELENNQGTIVELANKILEGSEWKTDKNSPNIKQTNDEALYVYELEEDIEATVLDDFNFTKAGYPEYTIDYKKDDKVIISKGEKIYIFYSSFVNKDKELQFLYNPDIYLLSEDGYILNSPNFSFEVNDSFFEKELDITTEYFGEKLIKKQISKYIPEIDKYCSLYKKDEEEYYGFTTTEYMAVTEIQNLITNNQNFINTTGWTADLNSGSSILQRTVKDTLTNKMVNCLRIKFGSIDSIKNSGIYDNKKLTQGFTKGEKYIFAAKWQEYSGGYISNNSRIVAIKRTAEENYPIIFFEFNQSITNIPVSLAGYTVYEASCKQSISYTDLLDCNMDFILNGVGTVNLIDLKVFKKLVGTDGNIIVPNLETEINSIIRTKYSFFKKKQLDDPSLNIFNINDLTIEESFYEEDLDVSEYKPVYPENFEKITSISAQKSNRFNLIQNLCENFGVWADFIIEHNEFGDIRSSYKITEDEEVVEGKSYYKILGDNLSEDFDFMLYKEEELYDYNKVNATQNQPIEDGVVYYQKTSEGYEELALNDDNFVNLNTIKPENAEDSWEPDWVSPPKWGFKIKTEGNEEDLVYWTRKSFIDNNIYYEKDYGKYISFKEFIGQDNPVGFRYGINLKSIQRNIDSEQIVSKIIIEPNVNELAEGGFCSIQDAKNNPTGENFIFNFDYYIRHNLLNKTDIYNDLYNTKLGLGLYPSIKKLNDEIIEPTKELISISSSLNDLYSQKTTQALARDAAAEEYAEAVSDLAAANASNATQDEDYNDYIESLVIKRDNALNMKEQYEEELTNTLKLYNKYNTKYTNLEIYLDKISKKKKSLINEFYRRYSRFIQEGTWISSDALDPELYYLDSQQVLYTSAFPKVSYTINVIEISQVEGFEPYFFRVGDKTYIEDTEFFGWNSNGTPYKEEIVVSEVSYSLDDASKNTIKVQNYKTQFEDLFQRIAAATQSLQYSEGSYKRAAAAINNDGTIKGSLLQNSFENNSLVLQNAKSESVVWDESGITVSSTQNGNEIVRIVGGGIVLSNDGGKTWTTGITGSGINANTISTGVLNTNNIRIFNGDQQAFQWDKSGINAYAPLEDGKYDLNQFVRFNHLGMFGYKDNGYVLVARKEDGTWPTFKESETYFIYNNNSYIQVYSPDGTYDKKYIIRTDNNGEYSYDFKDINVNSFYTRINFNNSDEVKKYANFSLGWDGISIRVGEQSAPVINVNNKFIVYGDGRVYMANQS